MAAVCERSLRETRAFRHAGEMFGEISSEYRCPRMDSAVTPMRGMSLSSCCITVIASISQSATFSSLPLQITMKRRRRTRCCWCWRDAVRLAVAHAATMPRRSPSHDAAVLTEFQSCVRPLLSFYWDEMHRRAQVLQVRQTHCHWHLAIALHPASLQLLNVERHGWCITIAEGAVLLRHVDRGAGVHRHVDALRRARGGESDSATCAANH